MEKNPINVKPLIKNFKFEHVGLTLFCYLPNSSILYLYQYVYDQIYNRATSEYISNNEIDEIDDEDKKAIVYKNGHIVLTGESNLIGNIQKVISDYNYSQDYSIFVITDQGLYAYGTGSKYRVLGLGYYGEIINDLILVPNIEGNVLQVFTSGKSTFVFTDEGLFACGYNEYGELGIGHVDSISTFHRVPNITGNVQDVIIIAKFRSYSTFVLTDQGLFACGDNRHGQLALGHKNDILTFTRVPNIDGKILKFFTSNESIFVLTDKGLFTYRNNIVSTFTKASDVTGNIQQVIAGENHIFVLTDQGLFTWGNNSCGQLGLGHKNAVSDFTRVPNIIGNIQQVIVGTYHTFVLTNRGLYACGSNTQGQLGLGKLLEVSTFHKVPNILGSIQQVLTNDSCTFILTDQGLFACGINSDEEIKNLYHSDQTGFFKRLTNIKGKIQKMISMDYIQTEEAIYVLNKENMLFEPVNLYAEEFPFPTHLQLQEETKIVPGAGLKTQINIIPAYICPISQQIMLDPIMAEDGHTYERQEIQGALRRKLVSPITNEAVNSTQLFPNHAIRSAIAELLTKHPELWEENNVYGETVYFSTELQNQAITALRVGTLAILTQCLERDPRLLTHNTPTTRNFLELACQQGSLETLKIVLKAMKKTTWEEVLKQTSAEKLFQLCSQHLGTQAAKLLGDNLGWTVEQYQEQAYIAIKQGDMQLLSTCLMAGVSVNAVDAKGKSLINYAAECRQIPIVVHLLKAGAKVKLVNNDILTPVQETPTLKHESSTQATDAEQIKANLHLLNLDTDNLQTPLTSSVEVNQLQEQVALLTKTVQQLQAEVAYLKEQLKANVSNNLPLLGSQLPTFSSAPENNSTSYSTNFFRK